MRLYRFLLAIIISLFLLSAPLHVFAYYDLGDYDYTPVAKPDYKQYPATSEGFGAYCKDFALYCAAGTYDNTVQLITSFDPVADDLNDLYSYFDVPNGAEVFRRLLFPNSAFSPFYDPYYERDFHVSGTPGSVGSEEYVWGDGVLKFSWDFDRFFDVSQVAHSSLSDINNFYDSYDGFATPLYTMVSYNLPGTGSALWYTPHGLFNADQTERHYSGTVSNPTVTLYNDYSGHVMAQVFFDYTLHYYNSDDQSSWSHTYTQQSAGNGLVVANRGDPSEDEVRRILKGVPQLLTTLPSDDNIDDTPYCKLYSPDSPSLDPVPYYYYIDDDGNYYLTPDPVLPSYPKPDNAIPISPDGTVTVGGNTYMPINVLNSFSNQMQSMLSVALTSYYTNIFIGLGGDMSNCGCPDYSNWLMLINSKLGTLDYDLQRIYDLLLKIYNKQSGDIGNLPGIELPKLSGTNKVMINDYEDAIYNKLDYSTLFDSLRIILDYFVDGYADVDTNDYDHMFITQQYIQDVPDIDIDLPIPALPTDPDVPALPDDVYTSSYQILYTTGQLDNPHMYIDIMGTQIDLMSWYTPETEAALSTWRSFLSICLVGGWLLWFVRSLPSLFNKVGSVD